MNLCLVFLTLITTAYCLVDLYLYIRWKIRIDLSLLSHPASFWSSTNKVHLLILFGFLTGLFFFYSMTPLPILGTLFVFTLFNFRWTRFRTKIPLSVPSFQGSKLFEIRSSEKPHIIFLSLESFRAKNVGCLGAENGLSPYFDELASQGILFSNFHATGNLTNRSTIATLFGIYPAHTPTHLGAYCNLSMRGAPHIPGYHPALIQSGAIAFDQGADFYPKQGFKTILGKRDIGKSGTSWGVYDEHTMRFAAEWLSKQQIPTFLNLVTITNHHPWTAPPKWRKISNEPFFNTFAYTDWSLGLFIDELKKYDLLEKCILFIYGDHGQELSDRDPHFEVNRHLYQDNVHVPLLIYAKGKIDNPKTIDTVASQVDLLPTLLDLLNLQEPCPHFGKSLLRSSDSPIFFSQPFGKKIRGCRKGKWKYTIQEDREELYDLSLDPQEKVNLIGKAPSLKAETEQFFSSLEDFYSHAPSHQETGDLHLDLSNSQITDRDLENLAKANPDLASINLAHCLLLTDCGIQALLQNCPKIEKIDLEGLDEISGRDWPDAPYLIHFKALNCPRFENISWIAALPSLKILQFGAGKISDEELFQIASHQKALIYLHLVELDIAARSLQTLVEANPQLQVLFVENCSAVKNTFIEGLDRLRTFETLL